MQIDDLIGKNIDHFIVQERIGRGGMATVYSARQPSVNRSVALKIITLNPSMSEDNEFRLRFEQEANLIASLEHIHILPIFDYGIINNEVAYLAMRLLRGGSLADLLRSGPLTLDRTCDIFTQVSRGLAYAHSKGVVHRDLKPSNILMDDAGNAYLTDFGLAKLMENSLELTKTGNIVGTPIYMSPEQLRGENVDHRSDIYSMGVILYHMLVGHPPFESSDSNMVSVIYQHLEKIPTPPSAINPNVPPAVELVVLTALQKNPGNRYATADEMADELNAALGRKLTSTASYPAVDSSTVSTPTITIPQEMKPIRQRRLIYALPLVLIVAALLFAIIVSTTPPRRQPTVLDGEVGTADDAVPSSEEIDRARAYLGANGFIAYLACNQTSEYHATQAREMGDLARQYGLAYQVYDSDTDAYRQITLLERARTDGASVLIICPLDAQLLDPSLVSAQNAGIPMVFMHSDIPSYGGVLLAGDDYLMGMEAGRAGGAMVRDALGGQADVIVLDYPDLPAIVLRANGLIDGLLEIAPDANVIGRYLGGTRENGYASVQSLIEGGVDFNLILSINDAGSYGAVTALEEAGIPPASVYISSVDAEVLARQYIDQDYYIRASVDVGRELFSQTAINASVKLLAGSTLPETFLVPPGGAVTKDEASVS
jgi:serine/threonine protein kinase/DNA-binding LacI/PurR family transcriptional regulator